MTKFLGRLANASNGVVDLRLDVRRRDPDEPNAGFGNDLLANPVTRRVFRAIVDRAVDFDGEAPFFAVEVHDEDAEGVLTTELETIHLPVAKPLP